MNALVVAADDLTGAADTVVAFRSWEGGARVTTDPSLVGTMLAGPGALAVDLGTRATSAEVAYKASYQAARMARASGARLYKKVDSLLRGHPGPETTGALDAWPDALALVAPALPRLGRVVRDGYLVAGGASRPRSVTEALALGRPTFPVSRADLHHPAIRGSLRSLVPGTVVVVDAEDDLDLGALAALGNSLEVPVVWVGSAGLAAHVAATGAPQGWAARHTPPPPPCLPARRRGIVVAVGTREPSARAQVTYLVAELGAVVVQVGAELVDSPARSGDRHGRLRHHLAQGGVVVLLPGLPHHQAPEDPRHAWRLGREAQALGAVTGDDGGGADFVATGGETARALLDALGETCCLVVGEVEPHVPLLVTQQRGAGLVTRAGSFGSEASLAAIVGSLQAWRARSPMSTQVARPRS